jgi:hypothetical protein
MHVRDPAFLQRFNIMSSLLCNATSRPAYEADLTHGLHSIGSTFAHDELAYLALTGKPELLIRDRLAFWLHEKVGSDQILVAREWLRTDLAILLRPKAPVCLIELKAMYTFDAASTKYDGSAWTDRTAKDELKARRLADESTEVYSVLLATHPHMNIPEDLHGVVKYAAEINRWNKANGGAEAVRQAACKNVKAHAADRELIVHGEIEAGSAFGIDVSVLFWLMRHQLGS